MDTGIALVACSLISVGLIIGGYYFFKYQNRKAKAAAINKGEGVLWMWLYAPEDWKYAAKTFFDIEPRRLMETGKVCFTKEHIFVSNGKDEILFELIGEDRCERHLTEISFFKGSPMNSIRFFVRIKEIKREDGRKTDEEKYDTETLMIPIPKDFESEREEVFKYYQDFLDKNSDAIAAVSPYGLGLFGK